MHFRLLFVVLLTAPAIAAAQADPWRPFVGAWSGPGSAMGSPAVGTARWDRVLGGRYVRLEMSFAMGSSTTPAFMGHAYYSTTDSVGVWMDSQGNRYNLAHRITGDTLLVRWTMPNGTRAQSRYTRNPDGTLVERTVTINAAGAESVILQYAFSPLR